jgi:integrase
MFRTRKEAEHWAAENERSIRMAGLPLTTEALQKTTVGEIVKSYLKERTPAKGSAESERIVLARYLKRPEADLSLAAVSGQRKYGYAYRDDRLKETWKGKPITARTVWREITVLRRAFNVAREEWGYTNLGNPFQGIRFDKPTMYRRKRRLDPGVGPRGQDELDRLIGACDKCRGLNKYYVPLAINLAIETGMRLQEIFNLTWEDIDFEKRRIEIRKSKTDHVSEYEGRTIVMTCRAGFELILLAIQLANRGRFNRSARIFPMTKGAFKQSFADVVKRAGINPKGEERKRLTFLDMRREAGSRMDEAGLTKPMRDLQLGHKNRDIDSVYVAPYLQSIQEKLDNYSFEVQLIDAKALKEVFDYVLPHLRAGTKMQFPRKLLLKSVMTEQLEAPPGS